MSRYASRLFWVNAFDRALSTFAQTLIGVITAETVGILDAPWVAWLSIAGMSALVSILWSLADPDRVETGTVLDKYQPRHRADSLEDGEGE